MFAALFAANESKDLRLLLANYDVAALGGHRMIAFDYLAI